MSSIRVFALTLLAMIAFAGNSLLCRLALKNTAIDAASFTGIRLFSGALVLFLLVRMKNGNPHSAKTLQGDWLSALALFAYAAGFSFAYQSLSAATGALLLFSAVQASMFIYAIRSGERFRPVQLVGLVLAFAGLLVLLMPGLTAPSASGSALMIGAGIAWGIYTLRGKGNGNPLAVTAGNFLRTIPMLLALLVLCFANRSYDTAGIVYAICSGALASGLGYVLWYAVLPSLQAMTAATVQLSVPVLAAFGGMLFLDENLNARLVLASITLLGGIALVILQKNSEVPLDRNDQILNR